MLLPAPLPDELFASVLARMGRLNGMGDLREVAERCFGVELCPSFIDARLNLPEFCARLSDAYGNPEGLLEQLTCLGARRCLGEIDETAWRALVSGSESVSVGELTFFGAVELRFCPSCRQDDIDRHGGTYWHRSHQLPILHRCVIHGDLLNKAVIKRAALHQSFPLPGDISDEREADLPLPWSEHFAISLTAFSETLITQGRPRQGIVGQMLLEGLWEQRFLNSKGTVRTRELFEFLIPRICQGDGSEFQEEGLVVARQVIRSIREPAKGLAFGRALLLCALFGNWRIVAERCTWLEVVGAAVLSRNDDACQQSVRNPKNDYRAKCLEYIAGNPACSRLGFTRQEYRSFRWLLRNDSEWLDHYLPITGRVEGQQILI